MSALTVKCRRLLGYALAPRHFRQHANDVALDAADVGFDLFQRPRRLIAVEIAVEVDLVADETDLAIFRVTLAGVDPRVRDVGLHLALEERLDPFGEGHALGIAQLGVRLRIAVMVATYGGG